MKETLYFAEKGVEDTLALLARYGNKAVVLAGGTDLVPRINHYRLKPEVLVYIGNIGLDYVREEGGRLLIGAATPLARIAVSRKVAGKAGALAEAAGLAATPAVRTTATIGGNLAPEGLNDYVITTAADMPLEMIWDLVEVPHPNGPRGAKGFSEMTAAAPAPAIISAIHDAVGVWITDYPATPERILSALAAKEGEGS